MAEQTAELQLVLSRLERVEGRLRRLIWVTLALLGVTGAAISGAAYLWLTGPRPIVASTIAAKEFLLVDDARRVRAWFRQVEGQPRLVLHGGDDKVLTLGQDGERFGLRIALADRQDRVFAGVQPDFQGLGIWDANRIERGVFGLVNDIEDVSLRKADGRIAFEQP